MKKAVYRIISYSLDLLLCTIIVYALSMISFINPKSSEVKEQYTLYSDELESYESYSNKNYLEDKIISEEELSEINFNYPNYIKAFDDAKCNEELSDETQSEITTNVDQLHSDLLNDYAYKATKLNYMQVILYAIVFIGYFGFLQFFMNGQTVFKRMFRLKVVNNTNSKKKISLLSYIIRALLVTELVMYLLDTTLLYTLKESTYLSSAYWISQVKYLYEIAFLICIVIRDDQRSIHDLLLNTRVIRYDKNMNEIEEQIFASVDEEENKEKTNKKEIVKAEKVNDKKTND